MEGRGKLTVVHDRTETKKGGGGPSGEVLVLSVERASNGYIIRAFDDADHEMVLIETDRESLFKSLNKLL